MATPSFLALPPHPLPNPFRMCSPELTASLNKIGDLELEVKSLTDEQEALEKRMRLCDRTVC